MTVGELWLKSLDLASIATYLMIITVAVLVFVSRHSRKSTKK